MVPTTDNDEYCHDNMSNEEDFVREATEVYVAED